MMQRSRFLLANQMRSTTSLLGMGYSAPMRSFSSVIESKVFSNSIFMPELFPARLLIPTGKGGIGFTMENSDKIADFEKRVLSNTEDDVRSFELLSVDSEDKNDKLTLGQLKTEKFRMRVNNKTYDVYPDLVSLIRSPPPSSKFKKEIGKIDDINNSIPISR